jgi:hypothetical protein
MKKLLIILLVLLGVYWLFDHTDPLPLNHEQFGLYEHTIHQVVGLVFLVVAGLVGFLWKKR